MKLKAQSASGSVFNNYYFIPLLVLLAFFSVLSYQRIIRMNASAEQLIRTHLLELETAKMLAAITRAESSQRGFLLTRDSSFLHSLHDAENEAISSVQSLATRETDSTLGNSIATLDTILKRRLQLLNYNLELYKDGAQSTAFLRSSLDSGKQLMGLLYEKTNQLTTLQAALTAKNTITKNDDAVLTPVISLLFSLVVIIIFTLLFIRLRRQTIRQAALKKELRARNTELTGLNELFLEKNRALQRNNEEIASFSYVASHDLQEPLRKIQSFSQLIIDKEGDTLSATAKDYFRRIKDAAARMQSLIEDLLGYAAAGAGIQKAGSADLNLVLGEVTKQLHESIKEKSAVINAGNLPVIKGNLFQLEQLFSNLISNALKYSKKDEVPVINIQAQRTKAGDGELPGFWKIMFSDNGIGFDNGSAEKIFDIFHRLHGKSEYPGSGIGLAIAKKIADNHGGSITAEGDPGKGAVFCIYFPEMRGPDGNPGRL